MHFYKTPNLIQRLIPDLVWKIPTDKREIFLTFDDGPVPGVTEWVLEILDKFKARATFFVVGENVRKNNMIYTRILDEGHRTGNHTFNHMNSWHHNREDYLNNIERCHLEMNLNGGTRLFRPPHGKLTPGLIRKLKKNYSIIMWDVLTGDYNDSISVEKCLKNSLSSTSPGSIVVFHDSYKSEKKLRAVLPKYLEELSSRGYSFVPLL